MSVVGGVGAALPTPDNIASPNISMAAGAGKVALVNGTTAITVCNAANIIDFVGYGTTANCFEGSGPTGTISATLAAFRNNNGCTDTNDNTADFTTTNTPAPRNGATTAITCGAVSPTLSASALAGFGNVCINTTPTNSFTITGTGLTSANVTVAVLTGFTYSATGVGGPYSASLSLTQPGGAYSQQVFVKFSPTAIQSYNGNIVVAGGGASSINVAATGSGINPLPAVTTGSASAITTSSATLAGSATTACGTIISPYGVEYSTTSGFPNGTGTQANASNLSGGAFSSNIAGLTTSTIYYYHAYATNQVGIAYGAEQFFTTLASSTSLSATALSAFGNVCINTTPAANSFTITGTALSAANVTVGALAGFMYSATGAAGPYAASLSLTQPGGSYIKQIFVQFSPTLVQSYSANIPVGGGGASSINVAASGAGINTIATVTTGGASAITQTTATLAGSIPSIGCSAISAYGVEYSLTNGFANGTGTAVAASNLGGGNFSSNLTGLSPITTYYYHAYATNGGGTAYGTQQSFTTLAPVLAATALTGFGAICINTTTTAPNSFTINSTALTNANVNVGPLTGYSFATTAGGTYAVSLSLAQPGGPYSQTIYVKFTPVAVQSYNGNIPVSGGGAIVAISVAATGSGINTTATISTGNATVLSANAATATGTISSIGCSAVTQYGIEYSGINGFVNGSGTQVFSTNISGANFTATLNGLVQASTYYYRAFAITNGGIAYGTQQTFITATIPTGLVIYSNPVSRGANVHFTLDAVKPGHYTVQVFNSGGQWVCSKELIVQVNFIDDYITLPKQLSTGAYDLKIVNPEFSAKKVFMIW